MVSLSGLIHLTTFHPKGLIHSFSAAFQKNTPEIHFEHILRKDVELGVWGGRLSSNEKKNVWIVFDGTLQNIQKLSFDLKNRGISFDSSSQQDLILKTYAAWGEKFLTHLKGDFAIALFDEEKEVLFLARDGLGKKNLYWTDQGEHWLFSTEIKALLSTGLVPQNPSLSGFASYLFFGYIPQDFSPVKNVSKLLPGHYIRFDLKKKTYLVDQFWSLSALMQESAKVSLKEAKEKYEYIFQKSIQKDSKGEKVGVFFNDGAGCQTLTSLLEKEMVLLKEEKIKKISSKEISQELVKFVWHLDEPIGDPYALHLWQMAKQFQGKVSLVFSDAGWSELFGGRKRYFSPHEYPKKLSHIIAQAPEFILKKIILPLTRLLHLRLHWEILRSIDLDRTLIGYVSKIALFEERQRRSCSPLLFSNFDPEVFTQRFHQLQSIEGSVGPFLYFDMKTCLPDLTLTVQERVCAPFSLQLVTPYLSYNLIEYLVKIPDEIKFPSGSISSLLEDAHFSFASNKEINTRKDDPYFKNLFSLLGKGLLVEEGFISARWLKKQLSCASFSSSAFKQLWSVLILEIWFRLYIANPLGKHSLDVDVREFLE